MEAYFSNLFEGIRFKRSPILLLGLAKPDILKQSKLTDDEKKLFKNLTLEKLHRQRILKEYHSVSVLEKQFSGQKMAYPTLNNERKLLKIKTRDDEIKNLKYQTDKHDHERILISLKSDNES